MGLRSMAEAMRVSADGLARDNPAKAERVLQQASVMMAQFKTAYPYRVVSRSVRRRGCKANLISELRRGRGISWRRYGRNRIGWIQSHSV